MIAIINTIVSRMVLTFFGNDDDRETGLFAMLFGTSRKRKSGEGGGSPKGSGNSAGYGLAFLLIVIIILVLYFAIRQG